MKVNGYQSLVMLLIYQVSVPLYKPRDFIWRLKLWLIQVIGRLCYTEMHSLE
jgi:hypothetical protein